MIMENMFNSTTDFPHCQVILSELANKGRACKPRLASNFISLVQLWTWFILLYNNYFFNDPVAPESPDSKYVVPTCNAYAIGDIHI